MRKVNELFQVANVRETERSTQQEVSIHKHRWDIYLSALIFELIIRCPDQNIGAVMHE